MKLTAKKSADSELRRIKQLYKSAFPNNERKPWDSMLKLAQVGAMEILSCREPDFCGLAITVFWQDTVLLDYLAVEEKRRNHGCGGRILQALAERYQKRRIIVEIERPGAPGLNPALCLSRRDFYLRNGFAECGFAAHIYHSEFLLLSNQTPFTFAEYHRLYYDSFGAKICDWLDIRPFDQNENR
jgi:GNAT superfamily N-acetyltransferase